MDTLKNQQQEAMPTLKEHKVLKLDQAFMWLQ